MKYIVIVATVLTGCANSTDVHRTDADSLTVTVEASPGKGGIVAARRLAFEEAEKHCAPKLVQRIKETDAETTWNETMRRTTLDFRCVPG